MKDIATSSGQIADAVRLPPDPKNRAGDALRTMESYSGPRGLVEAIWRWLRRMLRPQRPLRPHSAAPPEGGSSQPSDDAQVTPLKPDIEQPPRDPPVQQPYPGEQGQPTVPIEPTASGNSIVPELAPVVGASPPADGEPGARSASIIRTGGQLIRSPTRNLFEFPAITPEEQPAADAPAGHHCACRSRGRTAALISAYGRAERRRTRDTPDRRPASSTHPGRGLFTKNRRE